jgi:hypothetical protein
MDEPAGMGKAQPPMPGGVFYTKELLERPDPDGACGPYAYGLSGFSDTLDEFAGGERSSGSTARTIHRRSAGT